MVRRHPWRSALVAMVLVLVIGGGVGALLVRRALGPVQADPSHQVVVTVTPGEGLDQVVTTLGRDHLVRSELVFSIYARIKGLAGRLHPGKFVLDRGMGDAELVAVLERTPTVIPLKVTVPDGLTASKEASLLQAGGLFSSSSYMDQIRSGRFSGISQLPGAPAGASWEGMAYGDTFLVDPHISAHAFLKLQLEDFDRRVRGAILAGSSKVGLTPYQVLVLASVVEAEAVTTKDRGLVAGVFFNRLHQGIPLQSDVTVLYAMAHAGDSRQPFSTSFPSPYNTYLHAGLPPGPIDSPGASAIAAVLHPTATPYMYFVSMPNGKMLFAVTEAQHLQQVQQAGLG